MPLAHYKAGFGSGIKWKSDLGSQANPWISSIVRCPGTMVTGIGNVLVQPEASSHSLRRIALADDFLSAMSSKPSRARTEHGPGLLMPLVTKRVHNAKPMRHLRLFDHKEQQPGGPRSVKPFPLRRFVNDHKKLALVTFREEIAG